MTAILDALIRRASLHGNPGAIRGGGSAESRIDVAGTGKVVDLPAKRHLAALCA